MPLTGVSWLGVGWITDVSTIRCELLSGSGPMAMTSTLITGGARSGKSRLALSMATAAEWPVVFVATATAGDDEMARRIAVHRSERPVDWRTIEEPVNVISALVAIERESTVVLDCLTLWTSNLLLAGLEPSEIEARAKKLSQVLCEFENPVVVTNEVGLGIVPDNEIARSYRDLLGRVNIVFGDAFERVLLAVSGRAIEAMRS